MQDKKIKWVAVATIVVVAVVLILVKYTSSSLLTSVTSTQTTITPSLSMSTFAVQLTDPPSVPNGTQSLIVNYSDLSIHESGSANNTGFIALNSSGSLNLLNLTNFTQTLGVIKLSSNMSFDMVSFNITHASIKINNTTYNVSIPNNKLIVRLKGSLNSTSPYAVIDFTPSILQIYAANQTIFVLVPSLRGIVIKPPENVSARVGEKTRISSPLKSKLEAIRPNISITNALLEMNGNNTSVSVTVKDNSNASVTLKHIMLFGIMTNSAPLIRSAQISDQQPTLVDGQITSEGLTNKSVISPTSKVANSILSNVSKSVNTILANTTFTFNNSMMSKFNDTFNLNSNEINNFRLSSETAGELGRMIDNKDILSNKINISVIKDMHNLNISNSMVKRMLKEANNFSFAYHNVLNFLIQENGSLTLPFSEAEVEGPNGYTLKPGSNATFTFNAPITLGRSFSKSLPQPTNPRINLTHIQVPLIKLIVNQTYKMEVIGEEGAAASINVTAS